MSNKSIVNSSNNDIQAMFNTLAYGIRSDFQSYNLNKSTTLMNSIAKKIRELDFYLDSNKKLLCSYDLTILMNQIREFYTEFGKIKLQLQKENFFKIPVNVEIAEKPKDKVDNSGILKNVELLTDLKKENEKCNRLDNEAGKVIKNVDNEVIKLLEVMPSLHLSNITNSVVICGAVKTSVFIEKCYGTKIIVACQQLRIRLCDNLDLYVHINGNIVMELSTKIRLAEYNFFFTNILKHFQEANLKASHNRWKIVDDLDHINIKTPSPNWSLIPKEDLIKDWSLFLKDTK